MKLIIGLGNTGEKYKNTRHNVGVVVVDRLQTTVHGKSLIIKKSDRFMNDSGIFVKHLISLYPNISISDLYIIHDDLDLPLGTWKIQFAKGPKEHGGINDIEQKLGTKDFWRIRVGVDNRKPEIKISGEDYVLQDFTDEEREILDKVIIEICKKLVIL